jgi:hypothetical protein
MSEPAPAVPSRAARRRQRRRHRRRVFAAVVGVLAVVAAGSVVTVLIKRDGGEHRAAAHDPSLHPTSSVAASPLGAAFSDPSVVSDVLSAARTSVVTVDSYDYRTLADNVAAGLQVTTGNFHDAYQASMSGPVTVNAQQHKTTQTCAVQRVAITSLNAQNTQAGVLVYGLVTTTDTTSSDTRSSGAAPVSQQTQISLNVTLDLIGGSWLIGEMSDLGQQTASDSTPPGTGDLLAAVAAGKQGVHNLINYRRASFASDFARALAGLGTTAAAQQTLNKAALLAAMNGGNYDYVGTIVAVGVEDAGFGAVTLLVYGHREQQKDNGAQTALPDVRSEVAMTRVSGAWLIDQFTTVASG